MKIPYHVNKSELVNIIQNKLLDSKSEIIFELKGLDSD